MDNLPNDIKKALIFILYGNPINELNSKIKKFLYLNQLIKNDNLTHKGLVLGISYLKLDLQCRFLDIELEKLALNYNNKPELAALNYYKQQGYIGSNAEGGAIQTIIKALMLDKLYEYNIFNSRHDACCRFLEAQLTILKEKKVELITSMRTTKKIKFLSNFSEIISTDFVSKLYPNLTIEFADAFYDAMNFNSIIEIAFKFSEDPYKFRAGWPDLTLIKNNEISLVEIKVKDKLITSQIDTISIMKNLAPYKFKVVKII